MPEFFEAKGYEQTMEMLKKLEAKSLVYLYFTGEKDKTGKSWCPDCVDAEPTILSGIRKHALSDSIILVVDVGNRDAWKDMKDNKFRQPPISINSIPSMLRWKGVERLDGNQCGNPSLVEMFFEEAKSDSSTSIPGLGR
ncbi:thioredoxin domain-containing protein 17 [Scaptodrosophila lebanonensis]|uniref:Thioredoxin domain-containing protein 17 n=1 Tax=Drosophila lebanonensis TaxID=7225 RepID=A0A6J2U2P0_DROLE|nr:thioredoxin domain-containing protein 17 [Scaptodrosophila lebanonensis]